MKARSKQSSDRREPPGARRKRTTGNRGLTTTDCRGVRRRGPGICANRAGWRTGGHPPPPDAPEGGAGGQRRVTPRQACPRPKGFGRNLRSKTRWFTGFCNSHQVSHFATFFIDARAEISVAESRFDILKTTTHPRVHRFWGGGSALFRSSSLAQHAPVFVCAPGSGLPGQGDAEPEGPPTPGVETGSRVVLLCRFDNDPSAGSPTETLLRLLLPLNDKVQWTSRDVAGSEPPASPRSEHFTGPFNR